MSWFGRDGKKDREATSSGTAGDDHRGDDAVNQAADESPQERRPPDELADLFLMMEEDLNELELEDVSAIVAKVDQPPPLVERISSGLDDPEELTEAILSSPTLSADVLRVVNSAAFALTSPITSIEHAVTYLGTNLVKGLVLHAAVSQIMQFETDVQKAAYMRVWRSSYTASAAAQCYAQLLGYEHPSVFATRALLAGIGDLALISSHPELSAIYAPKTSLLGRVRAQQTEIVANTAVLSSLLVRQWELPEEIFVALRHSLTPLAREPGQGDRSEADQREDALLYLACRVGDEVAFRNLRDLTEFNPVAQESADYYYLLDYIRVLDLGALVTALQDRKTGSRVQRIVDTFGG